MQNETFINDIAPGYLEHVGEPRNERVFDGMVHCSRFEVMEVMEGFRVDDVQFVRGQASTRWYQTNREPCTMHNSKSEALAWIASDPVTLELHEMISWPGPARDIQRAQEWMAQHFPELSEHYAALFNHDDDRITEQECADLDDGHFMTAEEAQGLSRYGFDSLLDEVKIELGNNASQQAILDKAEEILRERHDDEYEIVHNGSGRSEEMPSQLSARHDRECKDFEKLAIQFRTAITEYFVNLEPIQGEPISYGPFNDALEARDYFERTYPEFDGGSVTLRKIESRVPGVSPWQLRENAIREEYGDPEEARWGSILSESTTVLGRDVWEVSQDQAGLIYRHQGKQYDPSFLAEISDKEKSNRLQLATEFHAAVEVAKLERVLPESRTCDWCGIDLHTIDDHKTIDRQFMCNPCHGQYFLEQGIER